MVTIMIGMVIGIVIVVVRGTGEAVSRRGFMQSGTWLMASSQVM